METLNLLLRIDLAYVLILLIIVFYSLDQVLQNRFSFTKRPQHLMHTIQFQLVFFLCNSFYAMVTVFSIEWLNTHRIGLFYHFQIPLRLKLVLGVGMFDSGNYTDSNFSDIFILWDRIFETLKYKPPEEVKLG